MKETTINQNVATLRRSRLMFLIAAFASFIFSISLWFTGSRDEGLFVGIWVPSILALGCLMQPPAQQVR